MMLHECSRQVEEVAKEYSIPFEVCGIKSLSHASKLHFLAHNVQLNKRNHQKHFSNCFTKILQDVPLIICVDTNSLPSSGVVEYVLKGEVSKQHPDLKSFQNNMVLNSVNTNEYDDDRFTHAFKLESGNDTDAPLLTNMT